MNEQELNEKLAKWAEFIYQEIKFGGNTIPQWYWEKEWGHWEPPNFTQSLDACFKWLVPKATVVLADIDLSTIKEAVHKLFQLWAEQDAASHALALCLVIEKLIDSGVYSRKEQ